MLPDRKTGFVAVKEVAIHPVGARAKELLLATVVKIENARMLKKTADDRTNSDVFG